ncbi:MAG: WhiB family transcriptional regulator [Ilumatobacter sp.]
MQLDSVDWRSQAACQGEMGNAFYPPLSSERRAIRLARERRAKQVCASCGVQTACLEQALDNGERYGIWGGLTDLERKHLRAS